MRRFTVVSFVVLAIGLTIVLFRSDLTYAHCDTMDGPVVKAAQQVLETGNVNLVLIWVQPQDEATIKEAFQKTLTVRNLSPEAKQLADMYFFETLVRIHRAGEGAPYTGLKPAGSVQELAVLATDKALEDGSVEPLLKLVTDVVQEGIREGFKEVIAKKNYSPDDVAAGRGYVQAYVEFVHYAERLYEAAKNPAEGHYLEAAHSQEQAHQEEAKLASSYQEKHKTTELMQDQHLPWVMIGVLALVALALVKFIWR